MLISLRKFISIIVGLIIIGLLIWGAVKVLAYAGGWFDELDDSLKAAVLTSLSVIAVAVVGFYANKAIETKRSVEQAMRPKKLELYTEFNKFFMSIFANESVAKRPSEDELVKFFADKTPELITFASNEVIEKWGKLRVGLESSGANEEKMFLVEGVLRSIRTDLGHEKRGSKKGDILRLFVNDIDKYLKN